MTPLIISWPGHTKPGTVNNDMILNIDLAPTFLDIAGGEIPKSMQGKSYKSILVGKTPPGFKFGGFVLAGRDRQAAQIAARQVALPRQSESLGLEQLAMP